MDINLKRHSEDDGHDFRLTLSTKVISGGCQVRSIQV